MLEFKQGEKSWRCTGDKLSLLALHFLPQNKLSSLFRETTSHLCLFLCQFHIAPRSLHHCIMTPWEAIEALFCQQLAENFLTNISKCWSLATHTSIWAPPKEAITAGSVRQSDERCNCAINGAMLQCTDGKERRCAFPFVKAAHFCRQAALHKSANGWVCTRYCFS